MSKQLLDELNQGIQAMQLDLPEHVPEKLIDYIGLLGHWNRAFNLTAIRNPAEMLSKHLLDSLAVLPILNASGLSKEGRIADVGSGAGLPGIPLALSLPSVNFVLIDSNGKKSRFLNQAKMTLQLDNVEVVNQRVQDYMPAEANPGLYFDAVIARAYASTVDILQSTKHLQQTGTRILVMQGKLDETIELPGYALQRVHTLNVHGLNADRHLLEIMTL